jgi:hypothetical protein
VVVGAIGLGVGFVVLVAAGLFWWSSARHKPEYWTEQEMYEHLQAKGLDRSYQLAQGMLGYYLVKPKPGQNVAALVAAWEAGGFPREVTPMWREQPVTSAGPSSKLTFTFRGWLFYGRDEAAINEIRRCLED